MLKSCPPRVIGVRSPYPKVVTVWTVHQRLLKRLLKALSGFPVRTYSKNHMPMVETIVSTIGIWFFEYVLTGNPDSAFNNLFSSLWWTVQTVTTLGYGDLTPITLGGQLFSILVVAAGLLQLALIRAS